MRHLRRREVEVELPAAWLVCHNVTKGAFWQRRVVVLHLESHLGRKWGSVCAHTFTPHGVVASGRTRGAPCTRIQVMACRRNSLETSVEALLGVVVQEERGLERMNVSHKPPKMACRESQQSLRHAFFVRLVVATENETAAMTLSCCCRRCLHGPYRHCRRRGRLDKTQARGRWWQCLGHALGTHGTGHGWWRRRNQGRGRRRNKHAWLRRPRYCERR